MKKKKTKIQQTGFEGIVTKEVNQKKPNQVFLKQYLVLGAKDIHNPNTEWKAAFVTHTCAKTARDEFQDKFQVDVLQCMQVADSTITKDDMSGRNFWTEGINWETQCQKPEISESAKRYFMLKERAEFVRAEKRQLGITDWDSATDRQIDAVSRSLSEWEKDRLV